MQSSKTDPRVMSGVVGSGPPEAAPALSPLARSPYVKGLCAGAEPLLLPGQVQGQPALLLHVYKAHNTNQSTR